MWVTFDWMGPSRRHGVIGITLGGSEALWAIRFIGCGVTGFDADDCLKRVRDTFFRDAPMPAVKDAVLDIDVSSLDAELQPRLGNPAALGIWFPALNT